MTPRRAARLLLALALLGAVPASAQPAERFPGTALDDEAPARLRAVDALAPSIGTLRDWGRALGGRDAHARRTAVAQLRALGHESLPVMRARLRELGDGGVPTRALARALAMVHRRTGRADVADRLASALDGDATEATRLAVELISLGDALMAQHTLASADVLVDGLLRIAPHALRGEDLRARKRLGPLLAPAYVRVAAEIRSPALRQLARAGLTSLGMPSAHYAYERVPSSVLPALLRVHGGLRSAEALPHVVAHVGDPRPAVHEAAVVATGHFGERALPLLRLRVRSLLGGPAPADLDAAALLRLVSHLRAEAAEAVADTALTAAENALATGKLDAAWQALDGAPRQVPEYPRAQRIARAYLELGTRHLDPGDRPAVSAGERAVALRAFRRALRQAPPAELASSLRARILTLEAEQRRAMAIADVHALTQAAALDPEFARSAAVLDKLRGTEVTAARARRRRAGLAAAVLFAIAAALLYRDARQRRRLHALYSQTTLG